MRISDWSSDVCSSDLGAGADVDLWILGSSLFGAHMAALMGLPYAFASHFAPKALDEAIALYRQEFRPSEYLDKPYVMLGYNVFAADTDAEARFLASSMQHSFVSLRTGRSEEHTSELQSLMRTSYAVFCLKKKKQK